MTPLFCHSIKTNFNEVKVMFLGGCIFPIAESAVNAFNAEKKAFKQLCDSLPKDEADKLKSARSARRDAELAHQRALEVAREGRSLNFWGCR